MKKQCIIKALVTLAVMMFVVTTAQAAIGDSLWNAVKGVATDKITETIGGGTESLSETGKKERTPVSMPTMYQHPEKKDYI